MRTDEEILQRIEEVKANDWMGTQREDLIMCLPFDKAKPFLTDEATGEAWEQFPRDRESVLARMLEYMPFAWDKANNCRGISAGRSMDHFASWCWLIGEDFGDLTDYQHYGKDNLVLICERFGWDHAQWDDGVRVN